jgi:peptidoglycan hydrolase-like protein with peptidoglycan-binding domain
MTGVKTVTATFVLGKTTAPVTSTPTQSVGGTASQVVGPITALLSVGMTSPQVKTLQILLNQKGYTVVAPGKETTYFGSATEGALKRYQCKTLTLCTGSPTSTGYGATGPKTRVSLGTGTILVPKVTVTPFIPKDIPEAITPTSFIIGWGVLFH